MPIIEISARVINLVEASLPVGTKTSPTQIVRAALLYFHQTKLSDQKIFTLIGRSANDESLIESLESK